MKKKDFVTLILSTIGGILFSLGICMALIPEWGVLNPEIKSRGCWISCFISNGNRSSQNGWKASKCFQCKSHWYYSFRNCWIYRFRCWYMYDYGLEHVDSWYCCRYSWYCTIIVFNSGC